MPYCSESGLAVSMRPMAMCAGSTIVTLAEGKTAAGLYRYSGRQKSVGATWFHSNLARCFCRDFRTEPTQQRGRLDDGHQSLERPPQTSSRLDELVPHGGRDQHALRQLAPQ